LLEVYQIKELVNTSTTINIALRKQTTKRGLHWNVISLQVASPPEPQLRLIALHYIFSSVVYSAKVVSGVNTKIKNLS